jgi:GTP-binding protein HflX
LNLKNQDLWVTQDHLRELVQLSDTAGVEVVYTFFQRREKMDPAFFIGRGKCAEVKNIIQEFDANLVIFDDDLTPGQMRNLAREFNRRVIDRTGIILDIFAHRARTKEAKIQVELAQLRYLLPRLTGHWIHLSRQAGGIGTRGPGETQLETDRRLVKRKISHLEKELYRIEQRRSTRRKKRSRFPIVALVGYTNTGKSTLLNALTKSAVFVEDRLFATLDPMVRFMVDESGRKILFTDTVGFIRKLPHHLVTTFRSTLEEVASADLLLHIVDLSHPLYLEQMEEVRSVLKILGADNKPVFLVFNKVDLIEKDSVIALARERFPAGIFISAVRGIGLNVLKNEVSSYIFSPRIHCEVKLEPRNAPAWENKFPMIDIESRQFLEDKVVIRFSASQRLKEALLEFKECESLNLVE